MENKELFQNKCFVKKEQFRSKLDGGITYWYLKDNLLHSIFEHEDTKDLSYKAATPEYLNWVTSWENCEEINNNEFFSRLEKIKDLINRC